jgi:outer membrane protein OmpA-like peptidoglycan-associated protein
MQRLALSLFLICNLSILSVHSAISSPLPDTEDIIRALRLKTVHKPKSLDRSWSNKGISVDPGQSKPADSASIDLEVNFEFNSAQLSTDAQLLLNRLGRALNSAELHDQHFKITGHTDAVGTEAYNYELSQRRAQSVEDYLVRNMHIGMNRLQTEGKGFSQLADRTHPTSAANRRVQVINLGS